MVVSGQEGLQQRLYIDRYHRPAWHIKSLTVNLESTSKIILVKLPSAMTIATLFSSVGVAARVVDDGRMSIATMLGGEDGGQNKNIIVKRNMMDTFEFFLRRAGRKRAEG